MQFERAGKALDLVGDGTGCRCAREVGKVTKEGNEGGIEVTRNGACHRADRVRVETRLAKRAAERGQARPADERAAVVLEELKGDAGQIHCEVQVLSEVPELGGKVLRREASDDTETKVQTVGPETYNVRNRTLLGYFPPSTHLPSFRSGSPSRDRQRIKECDDRPEEPRIGFRRGRVPMPRESPAVELIDQLYLFFVRTGTCAGGGGTHRQPQPVSELGQFRRDTDNRLCDQVSIANNLERKPPMSEFGND